MSTEQDKALDWDSEVDQDGGGFTTLPDGTEVTFVVSKLEKTHTADGTKKMAKLELACEAINGTGRTMVRENLVLSTKAAWKLGEFFVAIGQRRHGEAIKPDWSAVEGATGRGIVGIETWTGREGDQRTSNKIKRFLDPPADEGTQVEPSFG